MKGRESTKQRRNDHVGLLNRFAVRRDRKVMEPAGGQPTPAISVLGVKSILPLSLMFEEHPFRNLKLVLA